MLVKGGPDVFMIDIVLSWHFSVYVFHENLWLMQTTGLYTTANGTPLVEKIPHDQLQAVKEY